MLGTTYPSEHWRRAAVSGQHSSELGVAALLSLDRKQWYLASGASSGFEQCLTVLERVRQNITGAHNASAVKKYFDSCSFMREQTGQQLTLQNASC